jgi:tetratricopeptide (TPR) repeat protein
MSAKPNILKPIVAATVLTVAISLPVRAFADTVPEMLAQLKDADPEEAQRLADEIALRWEHSGSPAIDLLLKRGKDAVVRGDFEEAAGHLTALTDHAPDFAGGWHLRASLYFQMDRPGLALHDLQKALHLNPNNFLALYGLGVIMEQLDRPQMAVEAYTLALKIYPHYEDARIAIERMGSDVIGTEL